VGVEGEATSQAGVVGKSVTGAGVVGFNTGDPNQPGVITGPGVWGSSKSGPGVLGVGEFGPAFDGTSRGIGLHIGGGGVFAIHAEGEVLVNPTRGIGVNCSGDVGIVASTNVSNPIGTAGMFFGNVDISANLDITGKLTKGGGGFKIDHPLDPANQYLSHSFVESPTRSNIYDGIATLDGDGKATVVFPDWFEKLNENFRYQLTAIGSASPNIHVAAKIKNNEFQISGGKPGTEVSWQVTGTRKDAWARHNPMIVEETKTEGEKGTYLHPHLYGEPESKTFAKRNTPTTESVNKKIEHIRSLGLPELSKE
jgi:hypothetical protein